MTSLAHREHDVLLHWKELSKHTWASGLGRFRGIDPQLLVPLLLYGQEDDEEEEGESAGPGGPGPSLYFYVGIDCDGAEVREIADSDSLHLGDHLFICGQSPNLCLWRHIHVFG